MSRLKNLEVLTVNIPEITEHNLILLDFSKAPLWVAVPVFSEGLAKANVIRWIEFLQVFNGCPQGQHSHV